MNPDQNSMLNRDPSDKTKPDQNFTLYRQQQTQVSGESPPTTSQQPSPTSTSRSSSLQSLLLPNTQNHAASLGGRQITPLLGSHDNVMAGASGAANAASSASSSTETQDDDDDDDDEEEEESEMSWVQWYTQRIPNNEFLCEVDEDFMEDDFNLCGLPQMVGTQYYSEALDIMLDIGDADDENMSRDQMEKLDATVELLYALIHQRFLCTRSGQTQLLEKYKAGVFGTCPRAYCQHHPVLPMSLSNNPKESSVYLFCPLCQDIYAAPTKYKHLDGCAFGTNASLLLIVQSPDWIQGLETQWSTNFPPSKTTADNTPERVKKHTNNAGSKDASSSSASGPQNWIYVPKIFGFKVHPSSVSGPKMRWLRDRSLVDRHGSMDAQ